MILLMILCTKILYKRAYLIHQYIKTLQLWLSRIFSRNAEMVQYLELSRILHIAKLREKEMTVSVEAKKGGTEILKREV